MKGTLLIFTIEIESNEDCGEWKMGTRQLQGLVTYYVMAWLRSALKACKCQAHVVTCGRSSISEAKARALHLRSMAACAFRPGVGWTIDREQFHLLNILCAWAVPALTLFLTSRRGSHHSFLPHHSVALQFAVKALNYCFYWCIAFLSHVEYSEMHMI